MSKRVEKGKGKLKDEAGRFLCDVDYRYTIVTPEDGGYASVQYTSLTGVPWEIGLPLNGRECILEEENGTTQRINFHMAMPSGPCTFTPAQGSGE